MKTYCMRIYELDGTEDRSIGHLTYWHQVGKTMTYKNKTCALKKYEELKPTTTNTQKLELTVEQGSKFEILKSFSI